MQSLNAQFYAFLVTVLTGVTIGILFDFYRVIRSLVRPKKVFTYLGDLTFWVIATLVVFFLLLIGNWGEIRFYVWVGLLVGVSVYLKHLSKYIIKVFGFIFDIINRTVALLLKTLGILWIIITYPFIIIHNIVIIPVGFLGTTCLRGFRWINRIADRLVFSPVKHRLLAVKIRIKKWFKS